MMELILGLNNNKTRIPPFGRATHNDKTDISKHFGKIMVFIIKTQMVKSVALQFTQERVLQFDTA